MLVNLKEILSMAEQEHYAVPCINTPNVETIRAVISAAEELNTPVIIDHAQVHDTVVPIERIGPEMLRYARESSVPVCVHLDHGSDYAFVLKALKLGFPSIMYDCSALAFDENVKRVKKFVRLAHTAGITVEAELGVMPSAGEDTHADGNSMLLTNEEIRKHFTDPEEAGRFARETGCDALAVIFGTMHGIYSEPPVLDIDRVREIRRALPENCRIVMHGASGVDFDQVKEGINAGCSKINYYSYMAKATTKFVADRVRETEGKIAYHDLQEESCQFMKKYVRDVLIAFMNGKDEG